jgi:hypothetical protein
MRLFEFAHGKFQDDLREILSVLQGRADDERTTSVVPFSAINNMLKSYGYAEVNQAMMDKIKDQVDKDGSLIQSVTDTGVVLNTQVASPEEPQPIGGNADPKSIDQMAHNAAKKDLQ